MTFRCYEYKEYLRMFKEIEPTEGDRRFKSYETTAETVLMFKNLKNDLN